MTEAPRPPDNLTRTGIQQQRELLLRRIAAYESGNATLGSSGGIIPNAISAEDRAIIQAEIDRLDGLISVSKTVPDPREAGRRRSMRGRADKLRERLKRSEGAVLPGVAGLEQLKAELAEVQALHNDFNNLVRPQWEARESWLVEEVVRLRGSIKVLESELLDTLDAEASIIEVTSKLCADWILLMAYSRERRHCEREITGSLGIPTPGEIARWPWGHEWPADDLRDPRGSAGFIYWQFVNTGSWRGKGKLSAKHAGSGQMTTYV